MHPSPGILVSIFDINTIFYHYLLYYRPIQVKSWRAHRNY
jgi:hypothetical protein